jgi:hypothetical protein
MNWPLNGKNGEYGEKQGTQQEKATSSSSFFSV